VADGHGAIIKPSTAREAEDLLRHATRMADDPFVALTQSYKRKTRDDLRVAIAWEDDEER